MLKQSVEYPPLLYWHAAASARLCVETSEYLLLQVNVDAAASARLCVETLGENKVILPPLSSRLRAAVC